MSPVVGNTYPIIFKGSDMAMFKYTAKIVYNVNDDFMEKSLFPYIGYIMLNDDLYKVVRFSEDGQCDDGIYRLAFPITEFGIGKYKTRYWDREAVVTAISPHKSQKYCLIGFIIDDNKRMFPTSWTRSGYNANAKSYDLVGWQEN